MKSKYPISEYTKYYIIPPDPHPWLVVKSVDKLAKYEYGLLYYWIPRRNLWSAGMVPHDLHRQGVKELSEQEANKFMMVQELLK